MLHFCDYLSMPWLKLIYVSKRPPWRLLVSWWHHAMKMFSAILTLCEGEGNPRVAPNYGLSVANDKQFHPPTARISLQWRHNECDGISSHQPHDCLLNGLFRRRSKKTSKLRITGLYEGNSPVTSEFPAQKASNAENVYIWWRHHIFHNSLSVMYST